METITVMDNKKIPLFTFGTIILMFLAALGVISAIYRLVVGLGATTNLSDKVPWGLWIGMDLSLVALSGCGFTFAALVYIFNFKKYHLVLRRAILMGLLGYISFSIILFLEIGRSFRFWHPIVMWQHHSVLFEVTWCVMLYTTVLALEFCPILLERFKMSKLIKIIHAVTIPLVMAGIILSTLHQSSLGSLFLILPNKLHPLWYTSLLPYLFLFSAVMVGIAMVIFESFTSSKIFNIKLNSDIISGLVKFEVFVLSGYLIFKIIDIVNRGALPFVFTGGLESNMFLFEVIIGLIIPVVLLFMSMFKNSSTPIFVSSIMIIIGVITNRINVSIIGLMRQSNTVYFPSLIEFFITIGVIAGGLLAFRIIVKYFNVFHEVENSE
ncbi:MAG: NrfD/PsrC family molybdoenzyme membrane anchor subunit [Candidatus Firestonebacteria bacterium]